MKNYTQEDKNDISLSQMSNTTLEFDLCQAGHAERNQNMVRKQILLHRFALMGQNQNVSERTKSDYEPSNVGDEQ